ncbi:substrate-binding domain-containing protein [Luteolibacter pohnpeiensis]|uniref:Substrate-binding domain-containing protein n=1 Tax=Luteolibacter pohnpeiensis TaxID=454153 RepID=A0A934VVT6_9BACT|nr:substrate-binding domain-containing protein [Luteolibacter pohnpeiensis]
MKSGVQGQVVEPDYEQAAQDAARHLLSLGLFNHAFLRSRSLPESKRLRSVFQKEIFPLNRVEMIDPDDDAGFSDRPTPPREQRVSRLVRMLGQMAKPVGVFADDDQLALDLMLACELMGLRVPQEVAILGCGNSQIEVAMAPSPLSSVDLNWRRVGRAGARVLSEMMEGRAASEPVKVGPLGVFARASTATMVTSNPMITRAIVHIRQHFAENLKSSELAKIAGMTERAFRAEFRCLVGHSPRTEIFKSRLAAANRLLRDTDLKLDAIALESGFGNARKLCEIFAQTYQLTPNSWRDKARGSN